MDKFIWRRRSVLQDKIKKTKKFYCGRLLILIFLVHFSGCKSFAQQDLPYMINGKLIMSDENSSICNFELFFYNKSEKIINEFTVVFYLFDNEGESFSLAQNNIVISIKKEIYGYEKIECLVNLDEYFSSNIDDEYFLDYLYISQIKYSDGSVWQDSFGMKAF